MEAKWSPSVWYRFSLQDFPQTAIGSVMPWMALDESHQTVTWKTVYMILTKSKHKRSTMKTVSVLSKKHHLPWITDIKFTGTQLCMIGGIPRTYICGMYKTSGVQTLTPIVALRYALAEGENLITFLPIQADNWAQIRKDILVRPLNIRAQDKEGVAFVRERILETHITRQLQGFLKGGCWKHFSITILNSNEMSINTYDLHGNKVTSTMVYIGNVTGVVMADLDEDKILLMCRDQTLHVLLYDIQSPENPEKSFQYSLPCIPVCFQLIGESIVTLFKDNRLAVAKLTLDPTHAGQAFSLGPWCDIQLSQPHAKYPFSKYNIADFSTQGLCLVVASQCGKVFVGHQEDWNRWTFGEPFEIQLYPSGCLTHITVDINHQLTVAALEMFYDNSAWTSRLHFLFID